MTVPTGRESDKFMLRLPDGMRDRIKSAAEANNRSMNAEIVATLEDKFPAPSEDFADLLAEIETSDPSKRADTVMRLNKILADSGKTSRFMLRKGTVALVSIGDWWTEDMAINESRPTD